MPFSYVPLLVVTGASGAGKTASLKALEERRYPQTRCLYFDSIGVPPPEEMEREFGSGERWQAYATRKWIARVAADDDAASVQVLEGQTRPSFVHEALEATPRVRAQVALLDCDPSTRRTRLAKRGQADLATLQMNAWAAYLRGQADALTLPVVDTSRLSIEEVADALWDLVEGLRNAS